MYAIHYKLSKNRVDNLCLPLAIIRAILICGIILSKKNLDHVTREDGWTSIYIKNRKAAVKIITLLKEEGLYDIEIKKL